MSKSREEEREEERRRKERRQEREEEQEREALNEVRSAAGGEAIPAGMDPSQQLDGLMQQAQALVEQCAGLYRRFFSGVDRRPPLEIRTRLDGLMESLQKAPKSGASSAFRFNSLKASYISNRDLWDKQYRDFESGKLNPIVAGMKKGTGTHGPGTRY